MLPLLRARIQRNREREIVPVLREKWGILVFLSRKAQGFIPWEHFL